MKIAVEANIRTCEAAGHGLDEALKVAFSSGAVMGLGVTGSGIIGLVILYSAYEGIYQNETRYLAGFGFGASLVALFAQLGGGIYTKAADVGADMVGKVESDIPEDDPRNPATIADLVGDNVGDCAGRGADLFESIAGEILAAMILGGTLSQDLPADVQGGYVLFPLAIHAMDLIVSSIGIVMTEAPPGKNV